MYTVVRFLSSATSREQHERIGDHLNVLIPGSYQGIRRAGDGFASEVATTGHWGDHRIAIIRFVLAGRAAIIEARRIGIEVCVDVAIEPEDRGRSSVLSLYADPELIRTLGQSDMSLEVSVYGFRSGDSSENEVNTR